MGIYRVWACIDSSCSHCASAFDEANGFQRSVMDFESSNLPEAVFVEMKQVQESTTL